MLSVHNAYRISDAFEAFRNGTIPREAVDPDQTVIDVAEIRKRYDEIKHQMGFAEAARITKTEFMMRIADEVS